MTGRTHDLAAFTALSFVIATHDLPTISLATGLVAFTANMVGGLAPDLDQPTSSLWKKMRAGTFMGKIISPLFGSHRFISHSILGVLLFGFITKQLLNLMGNVLIVDMNIVWWAFMIGYVSHLITDSITKDGIPLLFPIPLRFGFPPLRFLRIKTGGLMEKTFVFPILIAINIFLYYTYKTQFLNFLHNYIK